MVLQWNWTELSHHQQQPNWKANRTCWRWYRVCITDGTFFSFHDTHRTENANVCYSIVGMLFSLHDERSQECQCMQIRSPGYTWSVNLSSVWNEWVNQKRGALVSRGTSAVVPKTTPQIERLQFHKYNNCSLSYGAILVNKNKSPT